MSSLRFRKRHRLRNKEIKVISDSIRAALGVEFPGGSPPMDKAEGPDWGILFVGGKILAFFPNGEAFLTVRGLLKYRPETRFVTVDMGAVPYVYNGADVMTPGIVDAHPDIAKGDIVWIRDEKNLQPLAVGEALLSGPEMVESTKGKAIKAILHVGDALWKMDE